MKTRLTPSRILEKIPQPFGIRPKTIRLKASQISEGIVLTISDQHASVEVVLDGEDLILFLDYLEDARRDDIEIRFEGK